jgi:hypothetical protein
MVHELSAARRQCYVDLLKEPGEVFVFKDKLPAIVQTMKPIEKLVSILTHGLTVIE